MSTPEKKLIKIFIVFLSIILSSIMVKKNKYIAYFIVFLSWLFFIVSSYKNNRGATWFIKTILLHLCFTSVIYSIWNKNKLIDNYVVSLTFLMNVLFIFPMCLFQSKEKILRDVIKALLLVYLLVTFKLDNFKMKGGKFINVDKKWLITHLFVLLFIYQDNVCMSGYKKFILKPIALIAMYPLLFPIDEFLIHRLVSLCIIGNMWWQNQNWYK